MRGVWSELHPLAVTPIAPPSRNGKAAFSIAFKRPFQSIFLNIVFSFRFYLVISFLLAAFRGRRLGTTLVCSGRTVGFPLRPGLVACGDGRNASAYPPVRPSHKEVRLIIMNSARLGRKERRLISWRRSEATTCPATRLKPSLQVLRQSRSKSSRRSRSKPISNLIA